MSSIVLTFLPTQILAPQILITLGEILLTLYVTVKLLFDFRHKSRQFSNCHRYSRVSTGTQYRTEHLWTPGSHHTNCPEVQSIWTEGPKDTVGRVWHVCALQFACTDCGPSCPHSGPWTGKFLPSCCEHVCFHQLCSKPHHICHNTQCCAQNILWLIQTMQIFWAVIGGSTSWQMIRTWHLIGFL